MIAEELFWFLMVVFASGVFFGSVITIILYNLGIIIENYRKKED